MSDDPELDALLDAVARGDTPDWDDAEARATRPEHRTRVRVLRDVARVAEFHHTLQRGVGAEAGRGDVGRWGTLLLLERVGSGAGGEVHRAWDPALQREVALKRFHPRDGGEPDAADRLEEARALAQVHDPHVVTVYGAGVHDGRAGLWMEFLRGPTLEAEIARLGPLPASDVARLGAQLGRALRAAHATGTVHRDVKPANVVLERDGRAVLTDFGLGQRRASDRSAAPFSGTPLFMSPQRLAGASARPEDDLYALGVTLFCALAGTPPFQAETLDQLRRAIGAGPEPPLRTARPDAPPALTTAIARAMAPEPRERFAHAGALVDAFDAAVATGTPPPAAPRSRARPWLVAALVAAVALTWLVVARTTHQTPAPALPPAPAPVAADRAFDVSAHFMRRGRDGDAPLESGDRVAPGDRLSLEFQASRPVWVYVLDADDRGETYLLFPQPMFDRSNPIPADTALVLPGTLRGREHAWSVTSRGGHEHLLVVANPAPVTELERELSRLPAPVPNHAVDYARVGTGTVERLRGMGGLDPVPTRRPPQWQPQLFDRIRALAGREQAVRGPWVRQVVLDNPLR